ncbi:odorant receptor Or2-like [Formica exsecta]|uniref:odorant receptor Or2-like n=1 Tax=Formica exsecta TaxID=72781 RepID=UPI001144D06B|nr:odorant receptor Or2-like [Formica exsecta]
MVHIRAGKGEDSDPDNDTGQQAPVYYSWKNVSYDTVDVLQHFEWAIKLNCFALNIVGLWPRVYENACDKFLSDLRTIFSFFLFVFVGMIPAIHSLVRTWGDMFAIIDNLQFTLPLLTTIMKLVIIRWKKNDLILALNMIANDWLKAKSNKEQRVMIKCAQNARIILIFGYVLMIVGFSFLTFLPCFGTSLRYITNITDPAKILPLQTYYFYDKDQSPYYELTFTAQALLLIMAATCYTGVDNLLGLLVFHLCGQMENLKERLINMRQYKNFSSGFTFIVEIVEDHIRLIKYFDIVENTFTLLLLGLLLYFGTLFCLYGFLIVMILTEGREMSMMRFIYLISVALNICGHMCLYCVVGEILVAQCEGVYHAAYDYEWYTLKPEQARSLILIMIRANKPLYITAGKIFPMTLSMFCNVSVFYLIIF